MNEAIILETSRRTKAALFWSSVLHEPLFSFYGLLGFILYKDLNATGFQIALLTMLRPMVSILSFYWSARSRGRLRANVLGAGVLMRVPFLLCLWFDSSWMVIAAMVNYMLFYRAGTPAWMEILRRNIKEGDRGRVFSMSSAVGYGEGVLLSMAMGALLDHDPGLWKGLLLVASLFGLGATMMQAKVPIEEEEVPEERPSWRELFVRPWRDSLELMRTRRDFAIFQWGFMICGFAIMLIQPALPLFAVDELGISYVQMAGALSIAKGLGYVVSSPLWGRWMGHLPMHYLSSGVFCVMALFPLLLGLAKWQLIWFYVAYFWYGVGQGGSHLIWNMSGPYFAKHEESARYTGVGVVMVGLRGAVGPPLGGLISGGWGALPVLGIGSLLCLCSGFGMLKLNSKKKSLASN